MIDALGNEVIVGNWYGYSKQDSSLVTVVLAKVKYIKDGKARLTNVIEKRSIYGDPFKAKEGRERTMTGNTLFPVPPQE